MANLAQILVGLLPGKNREKNKKGATGYRASAGSARLPDIASMISPTNNTTLGTAGDPFPGTAPAAAFTDPGAGGGGGSAEWLALALSALGGGPDRNAYVAPFDAAAQRAQSAHAQALPQIAAGYDRLRTELAGHQAGVDQGAAQAQQTMAAQQAANRTNIAAMAAPVLAQLQAAGGTAALGSLTGALQAQVGTGQAQLAQQGAAQTQLSQNLQQAGTQSHNSRVADSQLAQQSAVSSAGNNLNQVLNALEQRKAQALQQYAADAQRHGSAVANARMQAMERDAEANDPMRQMEMELKRADLEDRYMDLEERRSGGATGDQNRYSTQVADWHNRISQSNSTSYKFLSELMAEGDTPLPALIGKINAAAKNGKVRYGGKNLDARWLRDRLTELDELERMEAEEEERRLGGTTKRR